jgi:hypothetical protein
MQEPAFSAAPEVHSFKGLLFDFDGISKSQSPSGKC